MSTDMQQYSIANQQDAIAEYATRRGYTIVRSYEDAGKSGLTITRRTALKELLHDVKSGLADYSIILVYDVSRWGRFQDCDESAYYEFICKEAGVRVEYCAEQFENDGSLTATVIKNIKRAMAGEYSRELSKKVWKGQSRIAAMGFNVCGAPGYGLRRVLLDEQRNIKMMLGLGQRKSIKTERTTFVPGPQHEIEKIKQVYRSFIDEKKSLVEIAKTLNAQHIPNVRGARWTTTAVRELLINEKYVGNHILIAALKNLVQNGAPTLAMNGLERRQHSRGWYQRSGSRQPRNN